MQAISILKLIVILLLAVPAAAAAAVGIPDATSAADRESAVILLIAFVSLALVVSFLCSVAETVLLSITPPFIESLRDSKPKRAALLQALRQDKVDRSLAAILTMNTISHTVGAIGAGAQSAVVFGSTWVGVFSAVMTLAILFLSEIIPKTLGAVYWRSLVGVTTLFIRSLIVLLYPLVLASEAITRLITHGKSIHRFSRDEFIAMAGLGEQIGALDEHESKIIHNLFRFRSLTATDIMTPRTVISALPEAMPIDEAQALAGRSAFSRLPVYRQDIDDITGFVLKDEILSQPAEAGTDVTLTAFKRKLPAVPGTLVLPKLLEFLLDQRQHIAIVVDEYGGTRGLVTLEDVIETLLGLDIVDEMDNVADMQALARQQWLKRAQALGLELAAEDLDRDGQQPEPDSDSE